MPTTNKEQLRKELRSYILYCFGASADRFYNAYDFSDGYSKAQITEEYEAVLQCILEEGDYILEEEDKNDY